MAEENEGRPAISQRILIIPVRRQSLYKPGVLLLSLGPAACDILQTQSTPSFFHETMTNSYSTFAITPQMTHPLKFMHYDGPKSTRKSTSSSHVEENCGAGPSSSGSLATSAPLLANTDPAEPPLGPQGMFLTSKFHASTPFT